MKEIGQKFNESRDTFSKSKIKEIRRNLYEIKNKNNLSASKIREAKRNLLELKKVFLNQKSIMIMMILKTKEQEI